jgi:hypothetical protein
MYRIVYWDVLPCKIIVDNYFTRQYIPEDNSEHQTYFRRKGKRLKDLKIGSWNVLSPYTMPEGKRGNGKPKLRWWSTVNSNIRILGERNWRNLALNGEEWRKLLKKARDHPGLSSE